MKRKFFRVLAVVVIVPGGLVLFVFLVALAAVVAALLVAVCGIALCTWGSTLWRSTRQRFLRRTRSAAPDGPLSLADAPPELGVASASRMAPEVPPEHSEDIFVRMEWLRVEGDAAHLLVATPVEGCECGEPHCWFVVRDGRTRCWSCDHAYVRQRDLARPARGAHATTVKELA